MEAKITIQRIKKTKRSFFEKTKKMNKLLAKQTKRKREQEDLN
jgi:hypothetical protein